MCPSGKRHIQNDRRRVYNQRHTIKFKLKYLDVPQTIKYNNFVVYLFLYYYFLDINYHIDETNKKATDDTDLNLL